MKFPHGSTNIKNSLMYGAAAISLGLGVYSWALLHDRKMYVDARNTIVDERRAGFFEVSRYLRLDVKKDDGLWRFYDFQGSGNLTDHARDYVEAHKGEKVRVYREVGYTDAFGKVYDNVGGDLERRVFTEALQELHGTLTEEYLSVVRTASSVLKSDIVKKFSAT